MLNNKQNIFRKLLSIILIIFFILIALYIILKNQSILVKIKDIEPIQLIPLFFLSIIFALISGIFLKKLYRFFGIKLTNLESFFISIVGVLANYTSVFQGSAIARGVYLKKKYNLNLSDFSSSLLGSNIIVLTVLSFSCTLSFLLLNGLTFFYLKFAWFLVFLDIVLLIILFFTPNVSIEKLPFITSVLSSWHRLSKDKKIVLELSCLSFVHLIIASFMMIIEFAVIKTDINFTSALFLSSISSLTIFFNITPGAIGVKEGFMVFSAYKLGINPTDAIIVAGIDRAIFLVIVLLLGPMASYYLSVKKNIDI